MNQPASQSEPLIEAPQGGSIEDGIMDGTPNQIQIDQDFSAKVNDAINKNAPEGDSTPKGDSKDVAEPESNNDGYEPAKEFTDFLNKEIAGDQQSEPTDANRGQSAPTNQPDLSVLQQLLIDNPHMAPAVKDALAQQGVNLDAPGDPATVQRLDGMQNTINRLVDMISSDRDAVHGQQAFEGVNDVYLDVVKDVPDYGRTLTDFFSNALLRDHDLSSINRELLQESNKAVTSELNNYYEARLKAEGYSKPTGVPPAMGSYNGSLTPPPAEKSAQSADPNNRPVNAFDEVDKDFVRKVNNLFTQ